MYFKFLESGKIPRLINTHTHTHTHAYMHTGSAEPGILLRS